MRKLLKSVVIIFLVASIVLYSDKMSAAASDGLNLWLKTIIPSLFPFMVISSWMSFNSSGKKSGADKITLKLFGIPSFLMPVFAISFLSGYPIGAKIISSLYHSNKISRETAEHMLSFCNNPGIIFLASSVCSSMLSSKNSALFFIIVCVLSSLLTGVIYNLIFPLTSAPVCFISEKAEKIHISDAIGSAIKSILTVGGCIVFFSVVTRAITVFIPAENTVINGLIGGILEFAGGIHTLASSSIPPKAVYPLIAAVLCWGGFSVHLQSISVTGGCEPDFKKYLTAKMLCAGIAYLLAFFLFDVFIHIPDTQPAFKKMSIHSLWCVSSLLAISIYIYTHEKKGA